jgi:DNA invertase Pin-like site-specific DNA recombinase
VRLRTGRLRFRHVTPVRLLGSSAPTPPRTVGVSPQVNQALLTIAELELELGKERRAASREARVARGLAATKPMKLDAAQQKRLLRLYQQGEPVSELTSMFGISRSTLFRTLKVLKKREPVSA